MSGILSLITGEFLPYILGAVGALVAALWGRQSGKAAQKAKQSQENLEAVQRGAQGADEAKRKIEAGADLDEMRKKQDARWKK